MATHSKASEPKGTVDTLFDSISSEACRIKKQKVTKNVATASPEENCTTCLLAVQQGINAGMHLSLLKDDLSNQHSTLLPLNPFRGIF